MGLGSDYDEADKLNTAVGFLPPNGTSMVSIADVYQEFSWGTVIVFYLWVGHSVWSGESIEIFRVLDYAFCRYVGTWRLFGKSVFLAWAHRLTFIGVPTLFFGAIGLGGFVPYTTSYRGATPH